MKGPLDFRWGPLGVCFGSNLVFRAAGPFGDRVEVHVVWGRLYRLKLLPYGWTGKWYLINLAWVWLRVVAVL